jgi:hypothetical protein
MKEKEKNMFCSKCGKELNDSDIFCSGCGKKVAEPLKANERKIEESIVNVQQTTQKILKSNKNIYVLIMAAIMMALFFLPFYKIISRNVTVIEGWMLDLQYYQGSSSLLSIAKNIFHPEITDRANYFLVFFSFILAMGSAIGICACSGLFVYEQYRKREVNVSYISANSILSVVFALSVIFMNYSFEKLCQEVFDCPGFTVIEFSTKPIVWVLVALALLNNLVIYELYSKESKVETNV